MHLISIAIIHFPLDLSFPFFLVYPLSLSVSHIHFKDLLFLMESHEKAINYLVEEIVVDVSTTEKGKKKLN